MFWDAPTLIDRNFVIGYLLPSIILCILVCINFYLVGWIDLENLTGILSMGKAAATLAIIWLIAVLLLAINFQVLRILEGYPVMRAIEFYGHLHPTGERWLQRLIRRGFERNARPAFEFQATVDAARAEGKPDVVMPDDHAPKLALAAALYPDDSIFVLPTRFGNLFRAFEVYPRVLYGLDAIPAWMRMQAIIPKEAKDLLADAKAQLDFCVNLIVASSVAFVLNIVLAVEQEKYHNFWFLLVWFGMGICSYWLSLSSAMQFGHYVKSTFDLYRGDLANALGLDLPPSIEEERKMWQTLSRMMIYRSPLRAAELTRFRSKKNSTIRARRSD